MMVHSCISLIMEKALEARTAVVEKEKSAVIVQAAVILKQFSSPNSIGKVSVITAKSKMQ